VTATAQRVRRRSNPTPIPNRPKVLLLDYRRKLLAVTTNFWFRQLSSRFGFPDNYTTLDLETTGLSPADDLICAIGYTTVAKRRPVETKEVILDWTRQPEVDQAKLRQDLLQTADAMQRQNKQHHYPYERLRAEGVDPLPALQDILARLEAMEQRREVLIAHNGWRFDVEFLQSHFYNWLRIDFRIDPELMYDSGICEKASQLPERCDPLPYAGESLQDFSWRIGNVRARGIRWALDSHCQEQYGLFEKAGIDQSQAHQAGTDSLLLYHLFETHRTLAGCASRVDLHDEGSQAVATDN